MAMWPYRINREQWPPERYRIEIWERERWSWLVGRVSRGGRDSEDARPGDNVVFFYAPTGGTDCGFYGWAVVLEWLEQGAARESYFRPLSPSDHLKTNPGGTATRGSWRIRSGEKSSRAQCGRYQTA
jgi:hypothetical protein